MTTFDMYKLSRKPFIRNGKEFYPQARYAWALVGVTFCGHHTDPDGGWYSDVKRGRETVESIVDRQNWLDGLNNHR